MVDSSRGHSLRRGGRSNVRVGRRRAGKARTLFSRLDRREMHFCFSEIRGPRSEVRGSPFAQA
eukprot:11754150-Alexandrium_andersonii.AAC.1